MEKIPYKPGDVLVRNGIDKFIVIDLSKNEFLCWLEENSCPYTKGELDICGYTLKTPKEETRQKCEFCKINYCFSCYHSDSSGRPVSCECHFIKKETPTPWRPENKQAYWFITDTGFVDYYYNQKYHELVLNYRIISGNCFRTHEEAEEKLKEILNKNI
jgi:hypothetical protein